MSVVYKKGYFMVLQVSVFEKRVLFSFVNISESAIFFNLENHQMSTLLLASHSLYITQNTYRKRGKDILVHSTLRNFQVLVFFSTNSPLCNEGCRANVSSSVV